MTIVNAQIDMFIPLYLLNMYYGGISLLSHLRNIVCKNATFAVLYSEIF